MNEINWRSVAEQYHLSPVELEQQIFIAACVMSDMVIDRNGNSATAMHFTCEQPKYKLEFTVSRVELKPKLN